MDKKIILVLISHYIPGTNYGGMVKALKNLVELLSDNYIFKIITNGYDYGSNKLYANYKLNDWNKIGNAYVYHCSKEGLGIFSLYKLFKKTNYDILYLPDFFSYQFTMRTLILKRLFPSMFKKPIIIAAHGVLSASALAQKKTKKMLYIKINRFFKIFNGLIWHATSENELNDIKTTMGVMENIILLPNYSGVFAMDEKPQKKNKEKGSLKIIFLSRIWPVKNLYMALQVLKNVAGNIIFNIYGDLTDKTYWEKCKTVMASLPSNIKINYCGTAHPDQIIQIMRKHDIFLLPSLGENFGYVIFEALSAGCPVVISDKTPWKNLEKKKVGYDICLENIEKWREAIQNFVDMENSEHEKYSNNAFQEAVNVSHTLELKDKYLKCFDNLTQIKVV